MKKALFFIALMLVNGATLFGQENQSVLWEISGNGIQKPSYLFGTVHIAPIALLDSFPLLKRISESTDFAVFESGGSPIGHIPEQIELRQPPLDSLFTPAEYLKVDSFFTASPHGSMRPHNNDADILTMVQVALTMIENKEQYDRFDDLLFARMRDLKKPTFHLDAPEDIKNVIDSLGYQRLAKFLVYLVNKNTSLKNVNSELAFDLISYSKTLRNPLKLNEQPAENIAHGTVERNAHWLPKIENKVRDGSCFISVGLGHLQYETGLIQLLKQQGFTLKPIPL
ncbi:TraB/GumN family protein [Dyadobacter sp. OTU695]|uniref:TraB/GumN family protein n=1 Tax=Dyadobacter sp. OTU695 TaxID=3043860 RepID=UPI00313DFD39